MKNSRYIFGRWQEAQAPLTVDESHQICAEALDRQFDLSNYPVDKILATFDKLSKLWSDPNLPERKLLKEQLPGLTGFSPAMIELGLHELSELFKAETLALKLKTELRNIEPYGPVSFRADQRMRWEPLGTVLHVLAGNVFLVGAGSLVEGFLTRNITLLKMSSEERLFVPLLLKTLNEVDTDGVLSKSVAAFEYSSGQAEVIEAFKASVDGVVVWGGEAAVRAYRKDLPARTRLIVFGPKLSLGVVTAEGLKRIGAEGVAKRLADEVSIWDQNACTAPQMVYVQGAAEARAVVDALGAALELKERELPAGAIDVNSAAEIRKLRGLQEIAEARGVGLLKASTKGLSWTAYLDKNKQLETCPLNRTLRIVPFESLTEVFEEIRAYRSYVQTVGLAAGTTEQFDVGRKLSSHGVLRVRRLGEMFGGEIDEPHDGAYDLPQLMNLFTQSVWLDSEKPRVPSEYIPQDTRLEKAEGRLRELVSEAKKSAYYGPLLAKQPLNSIEDLGQFPILTRDLMEKHMPPQGSGLGTKAQAEGGYVTRSGGSTGEPKYSVYDGADWEAMMSEAVDLFRIMGLSQQDRIGNFMLAGDLYGSFVSFDQIINRLGVMTFAFGGSSTAEVIAKVWKSFGITAFVGIPALMMPFLRKALALDPSLRVQKVIYAGASMSAEDRRWLTEALGVEQISSVIGANDGGQIGFQCAHQSGRIHHAVDDFNWLEIVDPDGKPVVGDEPGRILITSLMKKAYPLIRYEIGDVGRWLEAPCECGSTRRLFEYLGRHDDQISIGIINFLFRDVQACLKGLPLAEVQLKVGESDGGEYMHLLVETEPSARAGLEKLIVTRLHEGLEKFSQRIEDGSLMPPKIEILDIGTIPRNPRTGKVKAIQDSRL
jgi:phenylacetate-CoA ligase